MTTTATRTIETKAEALELREAIADSFPTINNMEINPAFGRVYIWGFTQAFDLRLSLHTAGFRRNLEVGRVQDCEGLYLVSFDCF